MQHVVKKQLNSTSHVSNLLCASLFRVTTHFKFELKCAWRNVIKTLCNGGHVETRRAAKQTDTTQCVTFCVLFELKGGFLAERSDLANASGISTCHGTLIFSHMHTHTLAYHSHV